MSAHGRGRAKGRPDPDVEAFDVELERVEWVPGQTSLLPEDEDACPQDPDGQHFIGCGCEVADQW